MKLFCVVRGFVFELSFERVKISIFEASPTEFCCLAQWTQTGAESPTEYQTFMISLASNDGDRFVTIGHLSDIAIKYSLVSTDTRSVGMAYLLPGPTFTNQMSRYWLWEMKKHKKRKPDEDANCSFDPKNIKFASSPAKFFKDPFPVKPFHFYYLNHSDFFPRNINDSSVWTGTFLLDPRNVSRRVVVVKSYFGSKGFKQL